MASRERHAFAGQNVSAAEHASRPRRTSASLPSAPSTRWGAVWEKACSCEAAAAPLVPASAVTITSRRAAERRQGCWRRLAAAGAWRCCRCCWRGAASRAMGMHAVAAARACMAVLGALARVAETPTKDEANAAAQQCMEALQVR